ncbi:transposase, partial [Rhodovulum imhoffii]
ALTSGRTRREIAEDLGIGLSTLTRWLSQERDASDPSEAPVDLHAELKRLRRENAVAESGARYPKKSCGLLRERGKSMTFGFIETEKASFPIRRMCRVLGVSQSGFFAWQNRPACRRQQQDMVYLAHIRTAFALSNGTYGSPRMHRDLVDEGHEIGRHRTARLMRENQLIARQKRRFYDRDLENCS